MAIRADDIGFGGLTLLQDTDFFSYGIDAVLLADYSRASSSETLLDLGSGNGAVAFVAYGKFSPVSVTGIEVQAPMVQLAQESVRLNHLEEKMHFLQGDVLEIRSLAEAAAFDVVTCNPPYAEAGRGPVSDNSAAHVARFAAYALKPGGRFVLVHRPSRLPDIFECCRTCGLEPKRMRFVLPRPGAAPNIVLVSASKGGGKELTVDAALCVRKEDGSYSEELQKIYNRI